MQPDERLFRRQIRVADEWWIPDATIKLSCLLRMKQKPSEKMGSAQSCIVVAMEPLFAALGTGARRSRRFDSCKAKVVAGFQDLTAADGEAG